MSSGGGGPDYGKNTYHSEYNGGGNIPPQSGYNQADYNNGHNQSSQRPRNPRQKKSWSSALNDMLSCGGGKHHHPQHHPSAGSRDNYGGNSRDMGSSRDMGHSRDMGMSAPGSFAPGSSLHIDSAKEHFKEVDQLEQEVQVLEALRDVAHRQLEKALEEEKAHGEDQDGDLCVRVVEAELTDEEQVQKLRNKRVCIELECQGHPAKTYFHEGGRHLFWNETFDFPLPKEAMRVKEAYLRVAIMVVAGEEDAHGRLLCTRTEPVANLRDQRVQQRWCDFHNGWRVNLSLQWINSRSSLLQAHLDEFEARLTKEREKLVHVMDKVQHFVPSDVWHKPW